MTQPKPKLRFAPSPNGFMHIGHAYSALLNAQIAEGLGGEFIIRMEDIDPLRCTKLYKQACLEDLAAIGVTSNAEILYQSTRQAAYETALKKLMALGVLYPCVATRGDIKGYYKSHEKKYDPEGGLIYPNLHKGLSLIDQNKIMNGDVPYALRLDMQAALDIIDKADEELSFFEIDLDRKAVVEKRFDPMAWGDVVIARKDIGASYHLSVVVDDAMQGITHIVRGVDIYEATYIHRVLQILLGLPAPVYFHHQLMMDEELNKFAKSNKSQSIREVMAQDRGLYFISDLLKATDMRKIADMIVVIVQNKNEKKTE